MRISSKHKNEGHITSSHCKSYSALPSTHTHTHTHRDGRLRCDDEILSINGKSLSGMTQERAISLLRSTKGRVDLVVARVRDKTSSKVLVPSKSSKVCSSIQLFDITETHSKVYTELE